jgi:hypothetical protein
MYSESVTIEFSEHISQSGRMKYLAALAEELEQVKEMNTDNPGFLLSCMIMEKPKSQYGIPGREIHCFLVSKKGANRRYL